MNITFLYLIPKCDSTFILKNYRLIRLSNTMYKVVIKIIVNKIKLFLPSITEQSQASFFFSRRVADNIIILPEYITYFKKIKKKNTNMIFKN